jgi:hypothetical protein
MINISVVALRVESSSSVFQWANLVLVALKGVKLIAQMRSE